MSENEPDFIIHLSKAVNRPRYSIELYDNMLDEVRAMYVTTDREAFGETVDLVRAALGQLGIPFAEIIHNGAMP